MPNQVEQHGRLEGKVAIVTGSSNGIGRAITDRFTAEGAIVIGVDLSPPVGESPAELVQGDVADPHVMGSTIDAAVSEHGRLDILVNNAALQIEKSFAETTDEDLERMWKVNVAAVFAGCRLGAAAMAAGGGGSIINLASMLSFTADPVLSGYSTTKGAVAQVTRNAAASFGRQGVRVNAICPGSVLTPLTSRIWDMAPDPAAARAAMEAVYPLGRIVMPEEVAGPAVFLAGDDASAITGAMIPVDCGVTAANAEYGITSEIA
jgi:NAD(P)-dependent dehydrogenase (short-subunit alcohol dehydrogenase family)